MSNNSKLCQPQRLNMKIYIILFSHNRSKRGNVRPRDFLRKQMNLQHTYKPIHLSI